MCWYTKPITRPRVSFQIMVRNTADFDTDQIKQLIRQIKTLKPDIVWLQKVTDEHTSLLMHSFPTTWRVKTTSLVNGLLVIYTERLVLTREFDKPCIGRRTLYLGNSRILLIITYLGSGKEVWDLLHRTVVDDPRLILILNGSGESPNVPEDHDVLVAPVQPACASTDDLLVIANRQGKLFMDNIKQNIIHVDPTAPTFMDRYFYS